MAKRRRYRLRRRGEQQADTRRRIVEAAVELHTTIGPARSSFAAVAERAGVQRLTLYRHFPDQLALGWACSAHYAAQNPPPDYSRWGEEPDPGARIRHALDEMYRYYARTENMWVNVLRDAEVLHYLRVIGKERLKFLEEMRDVLILGLGPGAGRTVRAAVSHALDFRTWQSLVRQHGLDRDQAVDLMTALVLQAAGGQPTR